MMIGMGVALTLPRGGGTAFSPLTLFSSGEPGAWFDLSDLMTLYQDSAGTVPVTAAGQPVGRILDKSGRGNHATQPVASRRPTLGRHPAGGRRNLLTATEDFTNAAWIKSWQNSATAPVVTADQAIAPDGSLTADLVVFSTTGSTHIDRSRLYHNFSQTVTGTYTFSVWLKSTTSATHTLSILLANNVSQTVVVTDTWQRFSVSITSTAEILSMPEIRLSGNLALSASVHIWGAQLELGPTATPYQKVVSPYDVTEAGVPDCWYIAFDGVDDHLVTPTITPNIDKAQVFAGVRAIGTATGIVVENGDASTTNGTFALASPNAYLNLTHWSEMRGSTRLFSDTGTFPTIGPPRTDVVSFLYDIGGATPAAEMLPRLNGESKTLNVPAPPDNSAGTGNFLAYPLYIGGRGGTIYFFKGNLYGLAVRFGPNLDEATIAKTEAWLNTKTGAY